MTPAIKLQRLLLIAVTTAVITACGTTTQTVDAGIVKNADSAYLDGDWATAESYYSQLTEAAPDNSEAWLRMGNMRLRQNNVLGAVDAYQAAAVKQDSDAKSHYNLGTSYILLAKEALLKARSTLPERDVGLMVIDAKIAQLDALMNGQVAGITMPESGVFR